MDKFFTKLVNVYEYTATPCCPACTRDESGEGLDYNYIPEYETFFIVCTCCGNKFFMDAGMNLTINE